jgi:hypothetical protein
MTLYPGDWLNLAFYIFQWDEAVYIHDTYSRTYLVLIQPQSSIPQRYYSSLQCFFSKLFIYFYFWSTTQNAWEFFYMQTFLVIHNDHMVRRRSLCSKICCKVKIAGPFHELEAEQDSAVQSFPDLCSPVSLSWNKMR